MNEGKATPRRRLTEEEQRRVTQHTWLAESVAAAFAWLAPKLPDGDVLGPAQEGLIRAAPLYDPAQGVKFSTYAYPFVVRAILHAAAGTAPKVMRGALATLEALDEPSELAPEDVAEAIELAGATLCIGAATLAFARRSGVLSERDQQAARILDQTMSGFSEVERAIVVWHYGEGRTWQAIAEELKMKARTVRRRGTHLRAVLEERVLAGTLRWPGEGT